MATNNEEDEQKRPIFGNRILKNDDDMFQHNAWDNVQWNDEQQKLAEHKVAENSVISIAEDEVEKYEEDADKYWNKFYGIHQNRFFKDRHWLFTEFPELAPQHIGDCDEIATGNDSVAEKQRIFEIGCGVGNTVIPILTYNSNPNLFVYGCDFSSNAINLLQQHEKYDTSRCEAFILDATQNEWNPPFDDESLDIILLIFVLSSINPNKQKHVIQQVYRYLKPGGLVLFRDYGRFDMAQLRFKKDDACQKTFMPEATAPEPIFSRKIAYGICSLDVISRKNQILLIEDCKLIAVNT